MRGQYKNYDSFNLVELIDELKTRIEPPFRVDDTLHGAMIEGKDYSGTCKVLIEWLENDDKKVTGDGENTKENKSIISIDLEKVIGSKQVLCGRNYGMKLRNIFDLDNIDKAITNQQNERVAIMIPDTVNNISVSFFIGMFKKSIQRLGKEKFKEIYNFICDEGSESMIKDGINSILEVI